MNIGDVVGDYTVTGTEFINRWITTGTCKNGHTKRFREKQMLENSTCLRCKSKERRVAGSPEHNSWTSMLHRCTNPDYSAYEHYGAAGITVCDEWNPAKGGSFKSFFDHLGPRPDGTTLDRWPEKAGDYVPGNVRWASYSEQGYNQKMKNTNSSGKSGVCWNTAKEKWKSYITYEGANIHLGSFDQFEHAVAAREQAELLYFGELKDE